MTDATVSLPDLDDAACQRALAILLDVGTSIAKELKTSSPDLAVTDRANAFERVALAVRRTIILSRHIADAPASPRATLPADTKRVMQRKQIIRAVEETIVSKADPAEIGALRRELVERVETPEFDLDLTHRPPADIIRDLCRDLGVANIIGVHTFPRRTPADIARLNAQAAAPPKTPPPLKPSPAGGRGQDEGGAPERDSPPR